MDSALPPLKAPLVTLIGRVVEWLIGARRQPKADVCFSVSDVGEWLGASLGWVRDHASGRRQPRPLAIKLGPAQGKGLWKFREEDVYQFIQNQCRR